MHCTAILALCGILGAVAACGCNDDGCLQAVMASGLAGTADCSSYLMATVTPMTVTVTATATYTSTTTTDVIGPKRRRARDHLGSNAAFEVRQVTVSPTSIPAYATACSASGQYDSACSCIGVIPIITTVATPVTTLTTAAVTATQVNTVAEPRPTLTIRQFANGGPCAAGTATEPVILIPGSCALVPDSNTLNFGTYIPTGGTCSCNVQFYLTAGCSPGSEYLAPQSPISSTCYDADTIYAVGLVCSC